MSISGGGTSQQIQKTSSSQSGNVTFSSTSTGTITFNVTPVTGFSPGSRTLCSTTVQSSASGDGGGAIKISGFCGNAAKNYASTDTQYSGSFCYTGIQNPVNPLFPAVDGSSQWTCTGMTGGTDSSTCVATRGNGGGGVSQACSVYTTASASIPVGYGSPFNMLSSAKEPTLSVTCDPTSAVGTAGSQPTYVYKSGFVSENGAWKKIDFSGTSAANNSGWLQGSALANLPAAPNSGQNYVLAFVCQYSGGAWKCGCRDSACTQNYWTMQAYKK